MSLNEYRTTRTYSFKAAGTKTKDGADEEIVPVKKPLGIKTPIQLSNHDGLFDMHYDTDKLISDNLRNLLQTNHGERLGLYDYGANLRPLLFDLGTDAGDSRAVANIQKAVTKYLPFVSLDGFRTYVDREHNSDALAKIGIQVSYTIPAIDDNLRSLELMLYMGG